MPDKSNQHTVQQLRPGEFVATLGADTEANDVALNELEAVVSAQSRRVILSNAFKFTHQQLKHLVERKWITALAYTAPPGISPELYFAELPSLTTLVVEQQCVDLTCCHALRQLSLLSGERVSSLRLPATLESCQIWGLTELVLHELLDCTQLVKLVVKGTQLATLTPLAQLRTLTSLELGAARRLTSLSPLGALQQLATLDVADCPKIKDWSFTDELPCLRKLFIANCKDIDVDGLRFHDQIEQVVFFECRLRGDVAALRSRHPLARISAD
jgi:hypothetical protein